MDNLLFFLKKDVEREQKVEKKNLYLEQENVFGFLLSLIFFPLLFLPLFFDIFFSIYIPL
jgi:hypothetical protein